MSNYFDELAKVDCSAHVEKKGKFTYLSWPFAVAELAKRHPKAEIDVREWDGVPAVRGPKGWMVQVSVTIDGVRRTQWHPVLDSNNKAIAEPDVFQLNTSIQRATVKAIALHGLGLYIYAGEDLPEGVADDGNAASKAVDKASKEDEARAGDFREAIAGAADDTELSHVAAELAGCGLPPALLTNLRALYSAKKSALAKAA